jgi:hypothetical protein
MKIKKRFLYWLVYSLNAVEFVDFTCALIKHIQADKNCQEVIYHSCGHCPGGYGKNEGIRLLGFPERDEGKECPVLPQVHKIIRW